LATWIQRQETAKNESGVKVEEMQKNQVLAERGVALGGTVAPAAAPRGNKRGA
jgi:hypothetical protein